MSFLIDVMAERSIQEAINDGKLDDLPGKGQPLALEDDTFIPDDLKMAYHLLKNAGFLPPELQDRKEALELCDLVSTLKTENKDEDVTAAIKKLNQLELKLRIKGMNTQFLHRYLQQLSVK